jgi:tetratricopeptide (TPR) repeat protein
MSKMNTFIKYPRNFKNNIELIRSAGRPEVLTRDFFKQAGLDSSSAKEYVELFRSLELVDHFGKPSTDYGLFIGSEFESRSVISEKIWKCYIRLFEEERHAYDLDESELIGVFTRVYGNDSSESVIKKMVSTFKALVNYAGLSSINNTITQELAIAGDHMNRNGISKQNGKTTIDDLLGNRSVFPTTEYEDERKHSVDFLIELIQDPPNINYRNGKSGKRANSPKKFVPIVLKRRYDLLKKLDRFEEAVSALDQIIDFYENSSSKNKEELISKYMIEKIELYELLGDDNLILTLYDEFIERFHKNR